LPLDIEYLSNQSKAEAASAECMYCKSRGLNKISDGNKCSQRRANSLSSQVQGKIGVFFARRNFQKSGNCFRRHEFEGVCKIEFTAHEEDILFPSTIFVREGSRTWESEVLKVESEL
jgi:hypothetical protein